MSFYYLIIVSKFGILMSLLSVTLQFKHFLMILLSLEAVTMNIFILLFNMSMLNMFSGQMVLMFLSLGACEASLGLSIMIFLVRVYGNDYVNSFCLQKC